MAVRSINYLSMCTGGGGLDVGFDLAVGNARAVCYMEREAFACAHLVAAIEKGLMAAAPLWSDVTTFNGRPWRGAVDFVIGGIPCQPHSQAGKQLGEDDERDLWSDARRIIVQSGAWGVLIENVEGMLSSGGARRVRRDLLRLGFVVEGGLFSAAEVGATHQRNRVFILAINRQRLAHTAGAGLERLRSDAGAFGREDAAGLSRLCSGATVGDACGDEPERRRDAGNLECARGKVERETRQRQRRRQAVGDTSAGTLENANGRFGEGRPAVAGEEACGRSRAEFAGSGDILADANKPVIRGIASTGKLSVDERDVASGRGVMANAGACGRDGRQDGAERRSQFGTAPEWTGVRMQPPGPRDFDGWRKVLERAPQLEPAFRRMADGVAPVLDLDRIDRLRMLGNGVHPLQAAYAIRTLCARIAGQIGAGADEFVLTENAASAA